MKNELILSSLLLTAQITPAAMANTAIQKELNKNVQASMLKTQLMQISHPFKENANVEFYAAITVEKDSFEMIDLSLGKVTHRITVQLFDKENKEIQDFKIDDSEEGGFYSELRGMSAVQKTYVLWTCSSTMNCAFTAPGFLHVYMQDHQSGVFYYELQLPVISKEIKKERITLNFDLKEKLIK